MGANPIRIVLVTMDSHLSSAAARGGAHVAQGSARLLAGGTRRRRVGRRRGRAGQMPRGHRRRDIVVATMLFLDDHVRAVQGALAARRDSCDAMVCCMSAPDVTRLTRMGRFDMSKEAGGALAMLKRLRGAKRDESRTNGVGSDGAAQMRMLRRLPKLMRFIRGRRRTCARISWRCNTGWPGRTRTWRTCCGCWCSAMPRPRAGRPSRCMRRRRSSTRTWGCITRACRCG